MMNHLSSCELGLRQLQSHSQGNPALIHCRWNQDPRFYQLHKSAASTSALLSRFMFRRRRIAYPVDFTFLPTDISIHMEVQQTRCGSDEMIFVLAFARRGTFDFSFRRASLCKACEDARTRRRGGRLAVPVPSEYQCCCYSYT